MGGHAFVRSVSFVAAVLACLPTFADEVAEVFGAAPAVDHVRISPDGNRVLAISTSRGKRGLAVIDLARGSITVALQLEPRRFLDACAWASNERIVCSTFVFREGRGTLPFPHRRLVRLVAVDVDGGNPLALLDRRPRKAPKIGGVLSPPHAPYDDFEHALVHPLPHDPAHVLVAAPREVMPYRTVYRVNIQDGAVTRMIGWLPGIVFWHADRTGRVRAGTGQYEFGDLVGEPWRGPTAVVADAEDALQRRDVAPLSGRIGERELAGPRILGFADDATRLYYEARVHGADRAAVWEADASTLNPLRQIVSDSEQDVYAEAISGRDCGLVGFMHKLPGRPFTWLDEGFGRAVEAAQRAVETAQDASHGEFVAVTSMSADCQRVVLVRTDRLTRRSFHLLDRSTGSLRRLGEQFPNAPHRDATQYRAVRFETRDRLRLPMALTTPAASGAPRPLVVLLDGEQRLARSATLDTWPHVFASQGFVVAQPAFRGAKGYGTKFHLAGLRDFGAKLGEDVADAVAWLRKEKLGDADSVCFLGRGRGGHFALAAAFLGSSKGDKARCAAAYAATDMALTKRGEYNPFDGRLCGIIQCGDWMRWAAPATMRSISKGRTNRDAPTDRREVAFLLGQDGHAGNRSDAGMTSALKQVSQEDMAFASSIDKAALARERSAVNAPESAMLRSPLVDAKHPGFPVLIHADGESIVHERGTRRFRKDLEKLGFFEQIAPVGSEDESAFLAATAKLFKEQLQSKDGERQPARTAH